MVTTDRVQMIGQYLRRVIPPDSRLLPPAFDAAAATAAPATLSRRDLDQLARRIDHALGDPPAPATATVETPDNLPEFLAGVLSTFEPWSNQHPAERVEDANRILEAFQAGGCALVPIAWVQPT